MEIELLSLNEGIIEDTAARSGRLWNKVNDELYERLLAFMKKFPTKGGRFDRQPGGAKLLTTLRKELEGLLPNTAADEFMKELLVDFEGLERNLREAHRAENGITAARSLMNEQKAALVDEVVDSLNGARYNAEFAAPVKKVLYSHINLGLDVVQAERVIKTMVYGSPTQAALLTRYSGQVARDALTQYQGRVNTAIMERYELKHLRYVGNIVKDSRWQCRRWVDMEFLKMDNLRAEIRLAFSRGRGMIPGTSPDTFTIFRGGYNCLHTAFPSRRAQ